ncbi:hypothetical protein BRADI_4g37845v3 [Brachypodium distachyon]|uniref:Uncharacterized protein n=1 Tax=Brachypodium distachyon TaxID=15368 RepID=A0A0Q3PPQ6_BRADI|nr:hypothetical protein BRADI_4g37845v3 [Brachypodium distachyon]
MVLKFWYSTLHVGGTQIREYKMNKFLVLLNTEGIHERYTCALLRVRSKLEDETPVQLETTLRFLCACQVIDHFYGLQPPQYMQTLLIRYCISIDAYC